MIDLLNSALDLTNTALCCYIIGVVLIRLSMMSWYTHRHSWLLIYAAAGVSAAFYLALIVKDVPHIRWPAFFGYVHIAMWFVESRKRWLTKPPEYMSINCAHLDDGENLPDDCPLISAKIDKRTYSDRRRKPDAGSRAEA